MLICEATHNMINQASYDNGWGVQGIIALPESSGTVEVKGIVMFSQDPSEQYWGVADYVGNGDTLRQTDKVHFSRGTYDLNRDEAIHVLAERAKRG